MTTADEPLQTKTISVTYTEWGEYHYFATFTYSFGYRGVATNDKNLVLKRIWFDGKLAYDADKNIVLKSMGWYFLKGTEDQTLSWAPDEVAYRGQIILAFAGIDLGTDGSLPQVSAEFWDGTDLTVYDCLFMSAQRAGFADDKIDIDPSLLDVPLIGYILDSQSTLETVLTNLAFLYNFSYTETLGSLKVTYSYDADTGLFAPDLTIPEGNLALISESNGQSQIDVIAVGSDQAAPRTITASFFDYSNNYEQGSQSAFRRSDASASQNDVSFSMPVVMTGTEMRSRLFDALARTWNERNAHSLRLPPMYAQVDVGTPLQWSSYANVYAGVVVKATLNGDWSSSLSVTQQNAEYASSNVETTAPPTSIDYVIPEPVTAVVMDVPDWGSDQTADGQLNVRVAIGRADTANDWLGAHFDWADALTRNWTTPAIFLPDGEVGIGSLLSDDVTEMTFLLRNMDVARLADADKLLIVGRPGNWEELTFTSYVDNDDGSVTIMGLDRGLNGTDDWQNKHLEEDTVVFANDTTTIQYSVDEFRAFKQFSWRAVPTLMDPNDADVNLWVPAGNSRRPYSPNNIKMERHNDGRMILTFTRDDGRFGGEIDNIFSMDLYNADWSMLVRRANPLLQESWIYPVSDQITDGNDAATDLNILVYQINASHVGRGFPGGGVVHVVDAGELSMTIGPVRGLRAHPATPALLAMVVGPVRGGEARPVIYRRYATISGSMRGFGVSAAVFVS